MTTLCFIDPPLVWVSISTTLGRPERLPQDLGWVNYGGANPGDGSLEGLLVCMGAMLCAPSPPRTNPKMYFADEGARKP
jgi:hypothetical protein